MPCKGEIYFSKDFKYSDGEVGKKLFIILNNPKKDEPYVVVKTTTERPKTQYREGCNSNLRLFYIKAGCESFPEDTFIQFHELYPFTNYDFVKGHFKATISKKGELSDLCIRQILNCLRKIKEDISQQYYKLIIGH